MSLASRPLASVTPRSRYGRLAIVMLSILGLLLTTPSAAAAATRSASAEASAGTTAGLVAPGENAVGTSIMKTTLVGFDPGTLIDDSLFYDGAAMTAGQIQGFLDQRIGACENGRCLNVLNVDISSRGARVSQTTGNLICSAVQGGTMRISELIYRMQVACGISAKVILVTLQKEQGLTTDSAPTERELRAAMGASCPDTAPCDPAFSGVGPQIVGGVTQLKTYKAARFARQPGMHYIQFSPTASCGGTNVNITNYATAALYNYTPYQPNAASLAAGTGLGNTCSSYGNRNFYNYYTDWFGPATAVGNPFGNVEVVDAGVGGFRIVGWAADPDTRSPIQVHVYVAGQGFPIVADADRPDVGAAYPQAGAAHGFDARVPAPPGNSEVCIYAINTAGRGSNVLLSCQTVSTVSGPPQGQLDEVTAVEGGVFVRGWGIDPDTLNPLTLDVYVDSARTRIIANQSRADLATHLLSHGTQRGYARVIKTTPGEHRVCTYGLNVGTGANVEFGCKTVTVSPLPEKGRTPVGYLDGLRVEGTTIVARGWSLDPDSADPIPVHVYVGPAGYPFSAGARRDDVAASFGSYGPNHGFEASVPGAVGKNTVCAYGIDTRGGANTLLGCRDINVPEVTSAVPVGALDEASVSSDGMLTVRGWAFDSEATSPLQVHVYVGGTGYIMTANSSRPDVARVFPVYGANRGFEAKINLSNASPGVYQVCAYGINVGAGPNPVLQPCRQIAVG